MATTATDQTTAREPGVDGPARRLRRARPHRRRRASRARPGGRRPRSSGRWSSPASSTRSSSPSWRWRRPASACFEDKVVKNYIATEFLYDYLKDKKSVGVIDEDPERGDPVRRRADRRRARAAADHQPDVDGAVQVDRRGQDAQRDHLPAVGAGGALRASARSSSSRRPARPPGCRPTRSRSSPTRRSTSRSTCSTTPASTSSGRPAARRPSRPPTPPASRA